MGYLRPASALNKIPAAPSLADPIVAALGGAAARGRLHGVHPTCAGHEAAATAFALTLILALDAQAGSAAQTQPVLWVLATAARRETGLPYGPGLAALGLDPARLVVIEARSSLDVLAAAEMGLEEMGLAGVIADLPARLPADMLKFGKRLSLRAGQQMTPCCLVHAGPAPVEMPVASRWQIASRVVPRSRSPDFVPAFNATLTKNRFGALGHWAVTWDTADVAAPRFNTAISTDERSSAPLSEPVVPLSCDRPSAAPRDAQPRAIRPTAA